MKGLSILIFCFLSVACVSGYNPSYYFNEVQVVNLSGATIEKVSVRVIDSPRVLSCDKVLQHALCHDYFSRRRYPQQGIELSWTHPDGSQKSEAFTPRVPVIYSSVFPLRIVMEIREDGSVKPFYEQEEPSRDGDSEFTI
jgi:hypothetical protein